MPKKIYTVKLTRGGIDFYPGSTSSWISFINKTYCTTCGKDLDIPCSDTNPNLFHMSRAINSLVPYKQRWSYELKDDIFIIHCPP